MLDWKRKLSALFIQMKGELIKTKIPAKEDNLLLPEETGCGEIILRLTGDRETIQGKEVVFLGERRGVYETRIVEMDQSGIVHIYLPLSFHWVYRIGNVTGLILFDQNNRFEKKAEVSERRKTDDRLTS